MKCEIIASHREITRIRGNMMPIVAGTFPAISSSRSSDHNLIHSHREIIASQPENRGIRENGL
jgi:hypothetical protein